MSFDSYTNSGQGQNLFQQLVVQANRDPVNGVDVADPGGGPYQIDRKWINLVSKNYWRYQGQGIWVKESGSIGPALDFIVPNGTSPVFPDAGGNVTLTSSDSSVTITGSPNTIDFKLETGADITKIGVDAQTSPGTNPVVPDGTGKIVLEGGATFATGTQANPIRTNSLAANTIDLQIQLAGSHGGSSTANDFGVSQFDSNQFNVTSGFVQLKGGTTPPTLGIVGDDTTVVTPNSSGNITLQGLVVANATHAKAVYTESPGANTEKIDVQLSAAIASTDVTKVGLAAFSNAQFTVDSNGFVQLVGGGTGAIETITGDDGTAVTPVSANVNILGATVANGTNAKPLYTKKTSSGTETIDIQLTEAVGSSGVNNAGIASFNSSNFVVDSNGYVSSFQSNIIGASNLGIAYSGGTFTILGANGSALSSTNPAYVTVPSLNLSGQLITFKITSNSTFKDNASGSSQIAGNTFGVSIASGAYNQDLPFFLYAVLNSAQTSPSIENTLTFMISRMPNVNTTLGSGKISYLGSGSVTTQGGFFALASITPSNYYSSSALCIGSFRMQSTSSLADWTVQTLNANDGIGRFQENTLFFVPQGAFGAAANAWYFNNGGTAPKMSQSNPLYVVTRNNIMTLWAAMGAITSNGSGSVPLQLAAPYTFGGFVYGSGYIITTSVPTATASAVLVGDRTGTNENAIEMYFTGSGSFNELLNSEVGSGSNLQDTLGYFANLLISFS